MDRRSGSIALLVLGISSALSPGQSQGTPASPKLVWQHDWKSACDAAAADKKPILVSVFNDSEPSCGKMLDKVYGDSEVGKKLANFVLVVCSASTHEIVDVEIDGKKVKSCARYAGVLCSEHQALEKEMRDRFLDPATGGVVVPQHAIFDSTGKLLMKRPYVMKRDGFLEFLASGLAAGGDPASVPAAESARSPAVTRMMETILAAKSDEEREAAVKELLSDSSPERETALLDVITRLKAPAEKGVVIRAAGRPEQKVWAPTIATLLDDKDHFIRDCAVVTLEEEKNPTVVNDLLELWASEKDPEIRKDVLRALGPCGAGKPEAKKVLLEELASSKEQHRVACAMSLGSFLKADPDVATALQSRWRTDKSKTVQLAILWGIGESEDPAQGGLLERLVKGNKDNDVEALAGFVRVRLRSNLNEALKSLGKGGGKEIRRLLSPLYDEDKIKRNNVRDVDRRIGKQ